MGVAVPTYNAERWNYYPTTGTGGTGGGGGDPLPEEPFEPNPYDPGGNLFNFIRSGTTGSYGAYLGWRGDSRAKNSAGELPAAPNPHLPDPDSTFLDGGSVRIGGQDYASYYAYQHWSSAAGQVIRTGVNYVFSTLGWNQDIANRTINLLEKIGIVRDVLLDNTNTIIPVLENVSSDDFHGDRMLEIEKLEDVQERTQNGVWEMLDRYVPDFPTMTGRLRPSSVITPEDDGISQKDADFLRSLLLDQALTVANAKLGTVTAVASFSENGQIHRFLHIAASGDDLTSTNPDLVHEDPLSSAVTGRWLTWTIFGSALDDSITRLYSDATVYYMGAGKDFIDAGYGNDTIHGRAGDDYLRGNGGDDTIDGGAGADRLVGGDGMDTASYANAPARVVVQLLTPANNQGEAAGDTFDSIESIVGSRFDDGLVGTADANRLDGGAGADRLFGLDGNDTLIGGAGADYLSGGAGRDAASYAGAAAGVVASLADPTANTGEAAGDTYNSIENLIGTSFDDTLTGNAAANIINGGWGDDRLVGGAGADRLIGGQGLDIVIYSGASAAVTASLLDPTANTGDAAGDTYSSIENLRGSIFNDILGGDNKKNVLNGDAGNDMIRAYGGNDAVYGADGNDTLIGGGGADYLSGGAGSDTASYAGAAARVVVSLANPAINTGDAAGDAFNSIENLIGTSFDDGLNGDNGVNVIEGGAGNDGIKGYGGNDRLIGGDGNDTLIGGVGADTLDGGAGSDTASYKGATARVVASLANPSINVGEAAGDTFVSIENLTGGDFNDHVYGNNAANVISGGAGNDIIKGYGGNDTLLGGAGADIFVFNSALNANTNVDTIADFNVVADTIWLDDLFFQAVGPAGVLSVGAFRANASGTAASAADRILYETDTGKLFYDADGNKAGGVAGIHFATLTGMPTITAADFVVI
jgi:Ca2+-binding RTX toxin-like protein